MDLIEEMQGLARAFNDAEVEYALCGGLAMAMHGSPRATQDIDFLVPESAREEVLRIAETKGFWIPSGRMPFKAKTPLEMEIWRVSKAAGTELVSLDLIIVAPALQDVWEGRIRVQLDGMSCSVVSRDGLIAMKRLAGRYQDLADIEKLTDGNAEQHD